MVFTGSEKLIQELIYQKRYSKADHQIAQLLQENSKNADAYYLRGVSSYFQGQVSNALKNLKKAVALEPGHTDAAICLSVLLNDLGKYEEAQGVFRQAGFSAVQKKDGVVTGVDQKFSIKHLELGDLYFRYRRFDEAIDEYSKAVLLNPRNLEMRMRRAKACAKKGFITRALHDLQTLKHEHPEYLPARIQLGLLYYSQENLIDATLEWESVLEQNPNHHEARSYLEMLKKQQPGEHQF